MITPKGSHGTFTWPSECEAIGCGGHRRADPEGHKWCCRPRTVAEAEWSDTLAQRRARGELNPEVWPPLPAARAAGRP